MAIVKLSPISGGSIEEIIDAIERQRKDIEFLFENLDDDNIITLSGYKIAVDDTVVMDTVNYKDRSITRLKIAQNEIENEHIANVDGSKLLAESVTESKLAGKRGKIQVTHASDTLLSVTVTHEIGEIPEHIHLTPISEPLGVAIGSVKMVFVENVTASTFDVGVVGSGFVEGDYLSVYWSARP